MVETCVISSSKILLLSFDYLPGSSPTSTIAQLDRLIAILSTHENVGISAKELYTFGRLSELVINKMNAKEAWQRSKVLTRLEIISEVIEGIIHQETIQWIIAMKHDGTEFFSKFSKRFQANQTTQVFAPALAGVQTLLEEIAQEEIKLIEHSSGVILVERRDDFSVLALVKFPTHLLRQKLHRFADILDQELHDALRNFSGKIDELEEKARELYYELELNKMVE